MIVTVENSQYVIEGIAYGTMPAWKLIKRNGTPLTAEQFNGLPDADKQALATHVQQHINGLSSR